MAVDDYRKAYESAISIAKIGEHAADSTDAQIVSWDGGGGEETPRESQRTYSNPMHEQNDAVASSFAAHAADGTATGTFTGDAGAGTVVGTTTAATTAEAAKAAAEAEAGLSAEVRSDLTAQFEEILSEFIRPDASQPVNISHKVSG